MGTSISKLSRIASNAVFLSEQIDSDNCKNTDIKNLDLNVIEQRLQYWCQAIGGEETLKQRLSWDGLDFDTIRPWLDTVEIKENGIFPTWVKTLEELIINAKHYSFKLEREKTVLLLNKKALPFEDFYLPFIQVARQKLSKKLFPIDVDSLLSQDAYMALEYSLLQRLICIGTETLLFEFNQLRGDNYFSTANQTEDSNRTPNRAIYCKFVGNLLQDGGLEFFDRYPVLARLIAINIDLWVESNLEFIERLQLDLAEIELSFSSNIDIGKIIEIETSLANFHQDGHSVLALTFASGVKIVYKPKNLGLDVIFNRLLEWCDRQEISLLLKSIKIIDRIRYGWVEFIPHIPCENINAVEKFYRRAGMLLCLMFVLGAKDCGSENVIANSQYPILIDADILMQPKTKSIDNLEDWLQNSVLKMGFLPAWGGNIFSKHTQDSSVIGNIYPQQVNGAKEWKFINSDAMHLASTTTIIPPGKNAVILEGKPVSPKNYVQEIVAGFSEIYCLLIKNKELLLSQNSPISDIKLAKSRFIPHPESIYAIAGKKSLTPQALVNGIEYSILIYSLIDRLSCSLLESEPNSGTWKIWRSEIKSLQQQDIPYFSVGCDRVDLELEENHAIEQFFETSSYQNLITKLQNLDLQDLELQTKLIRSSFDAKFAHLTGNHNTLQGNLPQCKSITRDELLQDAIEIGNHLVSNTIYNYNECNWLDLDYIFKANRYKIQTLDDSLYTGRAGVALFLAALGKITNNSEFKQVALKALLPFQKSLGKIEISKDIRKSELGLLGTGGNIYSLVKISQFLEEPSLLDTARIAAKRLTQQVIDRDNKFDVMFGVAGVIPGLLQLYYQTSDRTILDIAIACGNHLLEHRSHTNHRAWITIESKKPLTGFSHGAAGISLSLLQLYDVTNNIAFLEAAHEAIAYEQSVFDASVKNWPDFRMSDETNQTNFLHTWCHGSAGIGLARLASLTILKEAGLQTEKIYSDIDIALETTLKYGIPNADIDHLCCGHMGRVELFILASQKLGNNKSLDIAWQQTEWVLNRAKQRGSYYFNSHPYDRIYSPNFYRGNAGVGYQLLRLAFPESLPSVLIWE
ncbi:MAG: type 2 lantipeptide synthetase LanM [Calothrix sp. CSU_2_0]|nr:type 2 lantipeptide synthetase LanM [Calothrix sp. CSU_2_0]